jgi:hypothetical protein
MRSDWGGNVAEESGGARDEQAKEPFVPAEDRPEVRISLETPLTDLTVRDLSAILGFVASKNPNFEVGKTSLKDFFDKDFPEVAKDWVKEIKPEKFEKPEKPEKFEKNEKLEKSDKVEKNEKLEKREIKEVKNEKFETDTVVDPGHVAPDPRIEQIIGAVAGLTKQVGELTDQVRELQKRGAG